MQAHGSYKIELHHQMIVVRFFESWNKQTAVTMCEDFLKVAKTISSKPWACLVDLREWGLGGPDVWQPVIEVNHWCAKNNQKFEAVVCSQRIQEYILRELQTHLPDTESEFFDDEESAMTWLVNKGFNKSY